VFTRLHWEDAQSGTEYRGLFRDNDPIVSTEESVLDGIPVTSVTSSRWASSPNGRFVAASVHLADGTNALYRFDLESDPLWTLTRLEGEVSDRRNRVRRRGHSTHGGKRPENGSNRPIEVLRGSRRAGRRPSAGHHGPDGQARLGSGPRLALPSAVGRGRIGPQESGRSPAGPSTERWPGKIRGDSGLGAKK
jgi:hypothetical protein